MENISRRFVGRFDHDVALYFGGRGGKMVPVIILTNLSDAAKASEALQHHAFDFLVKTDWKLEDVVRKARERLGEG